MFKYLRQLRAMISISASLLSWIEMGRRYLLDRARQGGPHSQNAVDIKGVWEKYNIVPTKFPYKYGCIFISGHPSIVRSKNARVYSYNLNIVKHHLQPQPSLLLPTSACLLPFSSFNKQNWDLNPTFVWSYQVQHSVGL